MTSRFLNLLRSAVVHGCGEAPVLEIGSCTAPDQEHLDPRSAFPPRAAYVGLDSIPGPGVQRVCDVFDEGSMLRLADEVMPRMILCAYVLEHVWEIRRAASILSSIWNLHSDAWLWVVTHQNQPFHGTADYPDYWRLTVPGLRRLFEEAGVPGVRVVACAGTSNPEDVIAVRPSRESWSEDALRRAIAESGEQWEICA